jgi:hypothetical protein
MTMVALKDAPGGEKLIASLTEAIKDLSLLYAHSPDGRAIASLQAYVDIIRLQLSEAVGAGTAEKMLEVFRGAVMGRKHEIEAGGASRA